MSFSSVRIEFSGSFQPDCDSLDFNDQNVNAIDFSCPDDGNRYTCYRETRFCYTGDATGGTVLGVVRAGHILLVTLVPPAFSQCRAVLSASVLPRTPRIAPASRCDPIVFPVVFPTVANFVTLWHDPLRGADGTSLLIPVADGGDGHERLGYFSHSRSLHEPDCRTRHGRPRYIYPLRVLVGGQLL